MIRHEVPKSGRCFGLIPFYFELKLERPKCAFHAAKTNASTIKGLHVLTRAQWQFASRSDLEFVA